MVKTYLCGQGLQTEVNIVFCIPQSFFKKKRGGGGGDQTFLGVTVAVYAFYVLRESYHVETLVEQVTLRLINIEFWAIIFVTANGCVDIFST